MIILIALLGILSKVTRERRKSPVHWLVFYLLQRWDKLKGSTPLDPQAWGPKENHPFLRYHCQLVHEIAETTRSAAPTQTEVSVEGRLLYSSNRGWYSNEEGKNRAEVQTQGLQTGTPTFCLQHLESRCGRATDEHRQKSSEKAAFSWFYLLGDNSVKHIGWY